MAVSEQYKGLKIFVLQTADPSALTAKLGELGIEIAAHDKSMFLVRTNRESLDQLLSARSKEEAVFTISDNIGMDHLKSWAVTAAAEPVPA